ncbi:small RNA-binding protein 11, chloroplastic-like isoform X1 [Typha angustifolia]|uniref:small RNA-binding protein 11, chloroplastic-like isoform X1 n=1 Tax=Typha angustifolia TaxID=59011 RepID=UPI003C2DEC5B
MAVLRVVSRFFTERSNHFSLLPRPPSNPRFLLPSQLVSSRGVAHKLFVGGASKRSSGLSFYTTEEALSEAFSQFGQVIEAKIIMDKVSVRSKGFGFVTFASEDEAHKALTEMNGKILNGRVVYVDNAKAKPRFDDSRPIARGPPEPADGN